MKPSTICLPDVELRQLLSGDLPQDDLTAAEDHLADCDSCRSSIENMIADSGWWDDARSSLGASDDRPHEFHNLTPCVERETNEQLLKLLGPTDDPAMLGRIGTYEIVGLLGRGGMGAVFKGYDAALSRFVAIKMLLPHLAASGAARKRFAREARAAAAVVDDHVMAIHGVSEWNSTPYFVMPYARGVSLQKRLDTDGPMKVREILRIGMQAAKGLAAAHAQGLVHRDVKPANIFLDEGVERVQLMDFGLARAVDDASLTRSGTLAGTPLYMSPEQARGESVDHHSDLFSLGCVLYTMCTGHPPFRADSSYGVLRRIIDDAPRPIREINSDIPDWLESFIMKLLTKRAGERFESAEVVAQLLEDCLAHIQQPTSVALPESVQLLSAHDRHPTSSKSGGSTRSDKRSPLVGFLRKFIPISTTSRIVLAFAVCGMFLLAGKFTTDPPDISGTWHSDEWGDIELVEAKPGRYEGTFTKTALLRKQLAQQDQLLKEAAPANPGKLDLKWSRVERRFNGTWREDNDHFGSLSIRMVNAELRGGWTTSDKAKLDAQHPRLSDLMLTRISAVETNPTAESRLSRPIEANDMMDSSSGRFPCFVEAVPRTEDDAPKVKSLQVRASIAKEMIGIVHIGNTASVRIDAFPLKAFSGKVTGIRYVTDPPQRYGQPGLPFEATISFDTASESLKPGMTGEVDIFGKSGQRAKSWPELEGTWEFVSMTTADHRDFGNFGRGERRQKERAPMILIGDRRIDGPCISRFIYNPNSKPPQFESIRNRNGKTFRSRYIIDLDGDTLRLGSNMDGGKKIAESFESPRVLILTFRRVVPKAHKVADTANDGTPRSAVETFLAAAFAGETSTTQQLAPALPSEQIQTLGEAFEVKHVVVNSVHVNDLAAPSTAIAITESVRMKSQVRERDGRRDGFLAISLENGVKGWHVSDIDFEDEDGVTTELSRFLARYPQAALTTQSEDAVGIQALANEFFGRVDLSSQMSKVATETIAMHDHEAARMANALKSVVAISCDNVNDQLDSGVVAGSGLIVSSIGYILTCDSVVEDSKAIQVTLHDGTKLGGQVVGGNAKLGIAVIKVDAPAPLPTPHSHESFEGQVGQSVVAVGRNSDSKSVTSKGVISAIERNVQISEDLEYSTLIQFDATLQPGTSGGALLNEEGWLIGINFAIRSGTTPISLAIPVTPALDAAKAIIERSYSGPGPHSPQPATVQVRFDSPRKARLVFDSGLHLVLPERTNLSPGQTYEFDLHRQTSDADVQVNCSLGLSSLSDQTRMYLSHNAVPVQITDKDFEYCLTNNIVTKAIYLSAKKASGSTLGILQTLVSSRVDAGVDVVAEAQRRGHLVAVLRVLRVRPDPEPQTHSIEQRLKPNDADRVNSKKQYKLPDSIPCRVTDEDGKPVPNARVLMKLFSGGGSWRAYEATTNDGGECQFDSRDKETFRESDGTFVIDNVTAEGYLHCCSDRVSVSEIASGRSMSVKMWKSELITAQVKSEDEVWLEDAFVFASGNLEFPGGWTGFGEVSKDGKLLLEVPASCNCDMIVYAKHHAARVVTIDSANMGTITIRRGTKVLGKLVNQKGKPLSGALVVLGTEAPSDKFTSGEPLQKWVETDQEGQFEIGPFEGVCAIWVADESREYKLGGWRSTYPRDGYTVIPQLLNLNEGKPEVEIDLTTTEWSSIEGFATLPDGSPVVGMEITATTQHTGFEIKLRNVATNKNGHYQMDLPLKLGKVTLKSYGLGDDSAFARSPETGRWKKDQVELGSIKRKVIDVDWQLRSPE